MATSVQSRIPPVSVSMVQGVFGELKDNGYSDDQVIALSAGLIELARKSAGGPDREITCEELQAALATAGFEYDLSMLGL